MSRITKEEAAILARKLVSSKDLEVEKLREAYAKKAFDLYNATIPKNVVACFKKHPTWFETTSSIKVDSFGFSREYLACPDELEVIAQGDSYELKLTRETASELLAVKRIWEKEKERVDKMRADIKNALINLHTYKKIIEQFPEAETLLPKKYSPPAVNYSSLKPVVRELATTLKQAPKI